MYRFAIIGGGLTATSMICQLVDRMEDLTGCSHFSQQNLSVDIFEKQGEIGPGMPHNARFVMPCHITNMCAEDMTVRVSRPGDFQTWVLDSGLSFEESSSSPGHPGLIAKAAPGGSCHHYPRAVMGEYLKARVRDARNSAKNSGVALSLHTNSEVVDFVECDGRIYLDARHAAGDKTLVGPFDGALLATGHWVEPTGLDNDFPSPWPADELLQKIPPGATVGVIGSSLSAIEVALTLTSDGRFSRKDDGNLVYLPPAEPRKITLYSRSGLLPRVRGRIGARRNRYLTCMRLREEIALNPDGIVLSALFGLLNRELADAYGRPVDWQNIVNPSESALQRLEGDLRMALYGDGIDGALIWQTVLVEIFPLVRDVYLHLTPEDRARFDREFNTLFFLHAATQPVINAEKIRALIKAGIVSVVRLGRHYRQSTNDKTGMYLLEYKQKNGIQRGDLFSCRVDARGQRRSVASDPSELMHNLLRKGIVDFENRQRTSSAEPFDQKSCCSGSVLIDPATHRVLPSASMSARYASIQENDFDLFAVGAMTRAQMIDASMAYGLARSTADIAAQLIRKMCH